MKIQSYKELIVWQKAMDMVADHRQIGYLSEEMINDTLQTLSEIGKMLFSMKQKLNS